MYRHNPLPEKYEKPRMHRSIVLTSPKFDRFNEMLSKKKLVKSQSRERSVHRIDSKQKPKMLFSPSRKKKNFQFSTSAGNQSQTLPFSRQKLEQLSDSKFISVSELLEKRNFDNSKKNRNSIKNIIIKSIINPLVRQMTSNSNRIKQLQDSEQKMDLNFMISNDYWQIYEGQFSQDLNKFHGYGCLILQNDSKFMGFFKQGYPEGHGTYYTSKQGKQIINGIWKKGQIIEIL